MMNLKKYQQLMNDAENQLISITVWAGEIGVSEKAAKIIARKKNITRAEIAGDTYVMKPEINNAFIEEFNERAKTKKEKIKKSKERRELENLSSKKNKEKFDATVTN